MTRSATAPETTVAAVATTDQETRESQGEPTRATRQGYNISKSWEGDDKRVKQTRKKHAKAMTNEETSKRQHKQGYEYGIEKAPMLVLRSAT